MFGSFNNIEIKGICSAVPSTIERNEIYTEMIGERRAKKQIKLTGVKQRHISAYSQRSSDLCWAATQKMLSHLGWKSEDIKVLIFITQGPDFVYPSTAFLFHKRLGLPKECVCFDMNLGCSSFNVGMQSICALMQSLNLGDKGLLLVGDTAAKVKSPHKAYKDDEIAHDMLFGSEGSCIALEKVENNDVYYMNMSDGNGYQAIIGRSGEPAKMDGGAVFSFAINEVGDTLKEFVDRLNIDREKTWFVFHQAQKLILDNLIDSCAIPPENELRSLEEYGNTSGGSVPLSICANTEKIKNAKEKKNYVLTGFGVGLSWGCIYTKIEPDNILPIIEYDECFEHRPFSKLLLNKKIALLGADNDLGEWISQYMYNCDAKLLLAGTDDSVLKREKEQMNDEADIYSAGDNAWMDENPDGIVYLSGISREGLASICEKLKSTKEENPDNDVSRIVIVCRNDQGAPEQTISELMETARPYEDIVQINYVEYDPSKVSICQIYDDGQAWIENYIEKGCPDELVKASYIAINISHLLCGSSKYSNGSVIRIS